MRLLEKEVLTLDDVKEILGPRQWEFNPLHEEYMAQKFTASEEEP